MAPKYYIWGNFITNICKIQVFKVPDLYGAILKFINLLRNTSEIDTRLFKFGKYPSFLTTSKCDLNSVCCASARLSIGISFLSLKAFELSCSALRLLLLSPMLSCFAGFI